MHDIRHIRENPTAFDRALRSRGMEPLSDRLIALDDRRKAAVSALQAALERRNSVSKEIGQAKAAKDEARARALMDEVAGLKERVPQLERDEREAGQELDGALAAIPNAPKEDVPVGPDESGNVERHRFGQPKDLTSPKQHFELGEDLGLMDFETAAKLSGSRFVVLKGGLARLERALGQFMLDMHVQEHGYTEVSPPLLVRDEAMFVTAHLPKFEDDQIWAIPGSVLQDLVSTMLDGSTDRPALQKILSDARYGLIPTAEVSLTNLVRERILSEDELPLRFTALTPSFRAEAGSAGRDTRGMIRQHQFVKCELVSVTTPETSAEEHERMLVSAENVLKRLDLLFRTMMLCTGDMGFASAKTYDIEVWLPGQGTYREISSCSVCTDFQARRMGARYRPADGKGPRFVHTLNGSGLAVGRTMVAILENYQNHDGTIAVPTALQPYMGGVTRIERQA